MVVVLVSVLGMEIMKVVVAAAGVVYFGGVLVVLPMKKRNGRKTYEDLTKIKTRS